MDTLSTNPARRAPAPGEAGNPRVVDVRDPGPLDALRDAYAERLALIAARAPEADLVRSSQRVRSLEARLRPRRERLRRGDLDPATFLG